MYEHISPEGLADIRMIVIDQSLPKDEKTISFVRQTNFMPYCYISGKYVVTSGFDNDAPTMENNYKRFML